MVLRPGGRGSLGGSATSSVPVRTPLGPVRPLGPLGNGRSTGELPGGSLGSQQAEDDFDGGLDGDGFAVAEAGAEAPAGDGVYGFFVEAEAEGADDVDVAGDAVFVNDDGEENGAGEFGAAGFVGVFGFVFGDENWCGDGSAGTVDGIRGAGAITGALALPIAAVFAVA